MTRTPDQILKAEYGKRGDMRMTFAEHDSCKANAKWYWYFSWSEGDAAFMGRRIVFVDENGEDL